MMRLENGTARRLQAYAVALAGAALAAGVRVLLGHRFPGFPFLTAFPVVAVASYLGGRGPGFAAAGLAGVAVWLVAVPPPGQPSVAPIELAFALAFYGVATTTIILIVTSLRRSNELLSAERAVTRSLSERQRAIAEAATIDLARYDVALRAGEMGVWDWDLTTDEMTYSDRARRICGFPQAGPITRAMVASVTHPDDLPRTSAMAKQALDPAVRLKEPYIYRITRYDDRALRWVVAHGEAVFASTGQPIRYVGTIQDITERRRNEEALQESEARLRLAIDAGRMAVWSYDVVRQTLQGSPELNVLLGFPADAEPTIAELQAGYLPGEQERVTAAGHAAFTQGERYFEVEYQYRRAGGQICWLLLRAEIILSANGSLSRVVGVLLDISERKRTEEQQQLLAAELAHRGKNVLAVVQSIAKLTFRNADSLQQASASFSDRLAAIAQANELLTRTPAAACSIRDLTTDVFRSFGPEVQSRIDVSKSDVIVAPSLALALTLVVHELAVNAMKYGALSQDSGTVLLRWDETVPGRLAVLWQESGGPPVSTPRRKGFGSVLLRRSLAAYLDGELTLEFAATGLICRFTVKLPPC